MQSQLYRRLEMDLKDKQHWIETCEKEMDKATNDYAKGLWQGNIIEAESTVRSYKNILDIYGENEKTAV